MTMSLIVNEINDKWLTGHAAVVVRDGIWSLSYL